MTLPTRITRERDGDMYVIGVGQLTTVFLDRTKPHMVEIQFARAATGGYLEVVNWYFNEDHTDFTVEGLSKLGNAAREHLKDTGYITKRGKNFRPRDGQKSKLYRAERQTAYWRFGERYDSCRELQDRVDAIVSSKWWQQRSKITKVNVFIGPATMGSGASAYAHHTNRLGHHITFAPIKKVWSEMVILHELAHHLTIDKPNVASHGREYAANYLALVQRFAGVEAAKELKAQFRAHSVKAGPKRTRNMSPEARQAAAERLAAARAAKAAKRATSTA